MHDDGVAPATDAEVAEAEAATREGYAESQGWCWVAPEVEPLMADALRRALKVPTTSFR